MEVLTENENKMGTMSVRKLLLTMAIPMIFSQFIQAMYNIVDSIFVSMISENALSAVSLSFPVQSLMISIATGTGVGINALLSRHLGAGNKKGVNLAAGNGIFLSLINGAVFMVLGVLFSQRFFAAQSTDPEIVAMGTQYLSICTIFSTGVFAQITCERLLQATGRTFDSMIVQGVGAIANIVLDPIFIFGWLGLPAMGIAGAAIATVAGQWIGLFFGIYYNVKKNKEIHFSLQYLLPRPRVLAKIYQIGLPSILVTALTSVTVYSINQILLSFTATATALYGIYIKIQSIFFLPLAGVNNAVVPILSYNYGAQKKQRLIETIRFSLIIGVCMTLLGLFVLMAFPIPLLKLFNASQEMITMGVVAFRRMSVSFIFAGFCIISISILQALNRAHQSMITSIVRQLVALIPIAYLLSLTGNLENVWWAYPIAEVFSVILSGYFVLKVYRETILPMKDAG